MTIPREACACGGTIVVPNVANREFLQWSLNAHYKGERHQAWSRAKVDPTFRVKTVLTRVDAA